MSKLRELLGCIAIAGAIPVVAPPPAAGAPPIKDQARTLIRVEGHQENFGTLASPQHSVTDYTLAISVAGEGALSVFSRRLNANNGETLDDPPRVTATRFRLAAPDLVHLQTLLTDSHIGQQGDCHSSVQFFAAISTALPPKQRLVWFGSTRRHELEAWHGSECSDQLVALLHDLADVAGAVDLLPQER